MEGLGALLACLGKRLINRRAGNEGWVGRGVHGVGRGGVGGCGGGWRGWWVVSRAVVRQVERQVEWRKVGGRLLVRES